MRSGMLRRNPSRGVLSDPGLAVVCRQRQLTDDAQRAEIQRLRREITEHSQEQVGRGKEKEEGGGGGG